MLSRLNNHQKHIQFPIWEILSLKGKLLYTVTQAKKKKIEELPLRYVPKAHQYYLQD